MKAVRSIVMIIGLLALGCGRHESPYADLAGKTVRVTASAMPNRRVHVISAWGVWLTCRITREEALNVALDKVSFGMSERDRLAALEATISRLEADLDYVQQNSGMVDSGKARRLEEARSTRRDWMATLEVEADRLVEESEKRPFLINMNEVLSYSVDQGDDGSTP